ncbi:MAG: CHAT domain-containing protein [Muribaculaceae bacterium]|nr:CHAT domain-containing protein [Muribaculaceae bacterium]
MVAIFMATVIFFSSSLSAQTADSDSCYNIAISHFENHEYKKAADWFRMSWENDSINIPLSSIRHHSAKEWWGHALYKAGNLKLAKYVAPLGYDITPQDRRLTVEMDKEFDNYISYSNDQMIVMAEECLKSILRNYEKTFKNNYSAHLPILSELMFFYNETKDFSKSLEYAKKIETILSVLKPESPYWEGIVNLIKGNAHFNQGQFKLSLSEYKIAHNGLKDYIKVAPLEYGRMVELFSNLTYEGGIQIWGDWAKGKSEQALKQLQQLLDYSTKSYFSLTPEEQEKSYTSLYPIVRSYYEHPQMDFKNFDKILEDYSNVIRRLDKNIYKFADEDLGGILRFRANINLQNNNIQEAATYIEEALSLLQKSRLDIELYLDMYLSAAQIYATLHEQDNEALKKAEEYVDLVISKASDYQSHRQYLLLEALPLKSSILQKNVKTNEAIELIRLYTPVIYSMRNSYPEKVGNLLLGLSGILSWTNSDKTEIIKLLKDAIDAFEITEYYPYLLSYYDAWLAFLAYSPHQENREEILTMLESKIPVENPEDTYYSPYLSLNVKLRIFRTRAQLAIHDQNTELALSLLDQALQLADINDAYYSSAILELMKLKGEVLNEKHDFRGAAELMESVYKYYVNKFGELHPATINALHETISSYLAGTELKKAEALINAFELSLENGISNMSEPLIMGALMTLATFYSNLNNNDHSLITLEKVKKLIPNLSNNKAAYYTWLPAYLLAKSKTDRRDEINFSDLDKEYSSLQNSDLSEEFLAVFLVKLAGVAFSSGKLGIAANWFEQAFRIVEKLPSLNSNEYIIKGYSTFSNILQDLSRIDESMVYYTKFINGFKELSNDSNPYFDIINLIDYIKNNITNLDPTDIEQLLCQQLTTNNLRDYASPLNQEIHTLLLNLNLRNSKDRKKYQEGLDYFRSLKAQSSHILPSLLIALFESSAQIGTVEDCEEIENQILKISSSEFSQPEWVEINSIRSELAFAKGEKILSSQLLKEGFNTAKSYVLDNFLNMSSSERSQFWNNLHGFFRTIIPQAAIANSDNSEFATLSFNNALFTNSLLLSSEITIDNIASSSKDSKVKRAYKDYTSSKNKFAFAKNKISAIANPSDDVLDTLHSLEENFKNSERTLLRLLNDKFGNYNRLLALTSEDVKRVLKENEVAIEFIVSPDYSRPDSVAINYTALILSPKSATIKIVPLFSTPEHATFDNCYESEDLTNLLWKPILPYIDDATEIWFAPQGKFLVTAIESLPGVDELFYSKGINLNRLSSTRQLVYERELKPKKRKGKKQFAIYGGIDFAATQSETKKEDSKRNVVIGKNRSVKYPGGNSNLKRDVDDGLAFLDGTLDEAEYIAALVSELKLGKPDLLTYSKGTEGSFKDQANRNPSTIHVGTHGFYYVPKNNESQYPPGISPEEAAMKNSGLLFAGADTALYHRDELSDDTEDGILTSAEIAEIDLSNTDFVSLSACETGLGEISADGVFGLQRGFKKAGVGTLLISLWKVDDDATSDLMKSFYNYWLNDGLSKREALEKAKRKIKNTYGWENPKYWAPFILIDAI